MPFGASNASEDVVFRYPPRLDTFHQPAAEATNDILVTDCLFAPGSGRENEVHARQVEADGTLFAPPESPPISPQDQVVIRGEVYEVIEKPRYWNNEGFEIPVRLVTG
jgi:hypothetical protein